jgi:hypothetical protein
MLGPTRVARTPSPTRGETSRSISDMSRVDRGTGLTSVAGRRVYPKGRHLGGHQGGGLRSNPAALCSRSTPAEDGGERPNSRKHHALREIAASRRLRTSAPRASCSTRGMFSRSGNRRFANLTIWAPLGVSKRTLGSFAKYHNWKTDMGVVTLTRPDGAPRRKSSPYSSVATMMVSSLVFSSKSSSA